ncbi:MAG: hypothetical protein WDZ63_08440 [Burkholderiales bacterium]
MDRLHSFALMENANKQSNHRGSRNSDKNDCIDVLGGALSSFPDFALFVLYDFMHALHAKKWRIVSAMRQTPREEEGYEASHS